MRKSSIGAVAATLIALVSLSGCIADEISPASPGKPVTVPSSSTANPAEQPMTVEPNTQESAANSEAAPKPVSNEPDIGLETAKATAFKHANVSASKATIVKAGKDMEDGVVVYEIEFFVNNTEYEYEIDAKTGEIRSNSKDIENFQVDD
jgi:hypothetical protein